MFERFTQDAREIVIRARQEAAELQHPMIGPEHLLLAMLAGTGTAAIVLREAGLQAETVRLELQRRAGPTALLNEEDAEALRSVGIDVQAVLARIEESFGPQALTPPEPSKRGWFGRRDQRGGFAPRSKKVLELSLREALRRHDGEIGSGHILLGLLRDGGGPAVEILTDAGLDLKALSDRTEQALPRAA